MLESKVNCYVLRGFMFLLIMFLAMMFSMASGVDLNFNATTSLEELDRFLLSKEKSAEMKENYFSQMLSVVKNIKSVKIIDMKIDLPSLKRGHSGTFLAFNPSIIKTDEGYDLICRTANYGPPGYKTYIPKDKSANRYYFLKYDKDLNFISQNEIIKPNHLLPKLKPRSLEDFRLFRWMNNYWFTCGIDIPGKYRYRTKFAICKLFRSQEQCAIESVNIVDGPFPERCEKNWMHIIHNDSLKFIYSYDPLKIIEPNLESGNFEVNFEYTTSLDFSRFRGSAAPIEFENGYLMMVHELIWKNSMRNYIHRFLFLEKNLKIAKISRPFTFMHIGIEYCISMVLDHSKRNLIIPIGIEDKEAKICLVEIERVKEMLLDI